MPSNFKNRSVDVHQFAMVPRSEIPRSRFRQQMTHKTAFDSGFLIPVYVDEILPGDSFDVKMTAFARLSTPIFPVMDNMYLESFFFFVPNRLVHANWVKLMGEQANPADSISFLVPNVVLANSGDAVGTLSDYFGIPGLGQLTGGAHLNVNALPFRAYNLIYNTWFRDENLINSVFQVTDDGPDGIGNYVLLKRGKRHDYFTSCLPFVQKGTAIGIPLGTTATVRTNATDLVTGAQANPMRVLHTSGAGVFAASLVLGTDAGGTNVVGGANAAGASAGGAYPSNLYADLSTATTATINALRLAFQTQKLLERDARGGTRYTELVRSHFGVISPDARLQRPEYLGGGSTAVNISPVAQTTPSGIAGTTTKMGSLAAFGTALAHSHGFSHSFTEHGFVIGLVNVRADLSYQQGVRKMWYRRSRYDHYFPVFAALGEQAVVNGEIYAVGSATGGITAGDQDQNVFGYVPRWDEYRYKPSLITGIFRSTAAGSLDAWHLAQKFTGLPTLNSTFISENPPVNRVVAVTTEPQFIFDAFFDIMAGRPLPMYSVPGLIDHF